MKIYEKSLHLTLLSTFYTPDTISSYQKVMNAMGTPFSVTQNFFVLFIIEVMR